MPGFVNNREIRLLLLTSPRRALRILHDQYYKALVQVAIRFMHDEDAARDIVQDTFQHVWLNASALAQDHERSMQNYLVKVVKYKAITYYKETVQVSKKKIRFLNGHIDSVEQSIESKMIQLEMTQEILDIIAKFPPREYQCLMMKIDEELSNEQISARLDVGIKAVERSLTSAKKRLRRHLQKDN
ncbi:MAG: sigma-70 family RNA polymerase sigma factor [Cyclobacteriaceae bacterium]|nr:sigma-70 family RNA polymerase sigma factor [Cyclobacteriaceae bacterium]